MKLHLPSTACISGSAKPFFRPEVAAWAATQGVAIAAALATAFLMAGCAGFSGIKPSATAITAEQVEIGKTASTVGNNAAWPQDGWWKRYADPQLDSLIDEALTGSPTLRVAQARLGKAAALAGLAESAATPGLNAGANLSRERFTENYIYPPPLGGSTYTISQMGLNFNWDIDFWGKNRAAIDASHSQLKAVQADGQAARLALTTSVTRGWFQLQRLYALRDVTEAAIKQRQDILQLTQQRVAAGLDTNVELRQAEAALPQSRVDLAQIDESIALVHNQMAALLGKGPDRGLTIGRPNAHVGDDIALPANLPAELIGRRPDLVAARWRVEASRGDIDAAKAAFYPNINLMAAADLISLGTTKMFSASSRDLSIGPAISLPIFQGSLRNNLRGKDADYDAAVEQYNQSVLDAFRDVADQITSLKSVAAQQAEQNVARAKTEEAYALAVQRYKAGIGNYLVVLTAESSVLQQRRADAELKARVLDLNVNLVRALGGGYQTESAMTPLAQR